MTDLEQRANDEARHGNREALEQMTARLAEMERDLKSVLDREAATTARYDARLAEMERERDEARARVEELEAAIDSEHADVGHNIWRFWRDQARETAERNKELRVLAAARTEETAELISAMADRIEALEAALAEVKKERDEARALAAVRTEEAASLMVEGRAYAVEEYGERSLIVMDMDARRDAILALATDEETDTLDRIRSEAIEVARRAVCDALNGSQEAERLCDAIDAATRKDKT
jgi:hypothetical protein